jgi:hypothetical protein
MIKSFKKAAAALLALVMAVSTTACSADKSWAMKSDSLTVPIGAYIYFLYNSYQSASSMVTDTTKPLLQQKVDGQNAEAWIKDQALTHTKMMYVLNDKMKELKLSLTTDETKYISSTTDSQWEQSSSTLEKYGISKSSFNLAYSDYYTKYQKVFNAIYGKGGAKAVSDADLKTYFEQNYSDFAFMYQSLYSIESNGTTKALTTAEGNDIKKKFDTYTADVSSGKKTLEQAAEDYKTSAKLTQSPYQATTQSLTSSTLPAELITMLKAMKNGEVKAAEISGTYVIVQKNDITKKSAEQLGTEEGRSTVLSEMKAKEYSDEMEKEAKAYTKAQVNQAAIDSYKPAMFETPASSAAAAPAASTAPSAATASTASTASTAASSK